MIDDFVIVWEGLGVMLVLVRLLEDVFESRERDLDFSLAPRLRYHVSQRLRLEAWVSCGLG